MEATEDQANEEIEQERNVTKMLLDAAEVQDSVVKACAGQKMIRTKKVNSRQIVG